MTKRTRRNHTAAFKATVALAAVKGRQDADGNGAAFRCPSEPGHGLEGSAAGKGGWGARRRGGQRLACGGNGGREDAARKDPAR